MEPPLGVRPTLDDRGSVLARGERIAARWSNSGPLPGALAIRRRSLPICGFAAFACPAFPRPGIGLGSITGDAATPVPTDTAEQRNPRLVEAVSPAVTSLPPLFLL